MGEVRTMPKSLTLICALLLSSVMALPQSQPTGGANSGGSTNSNNGGGQTTNPGTGQPGTGNVPGTGAGQGTGGDITTTPKATKKKKSRRHKDKNPKTNSSCANPDMKGGNPK